MAASEKLLFSNISFALGIVSNIPPRVNDIGNEKRPKSSGKLYTFACHSWDGSLRRDPANVTVGKVAASHSSVSPNWAASGTVSKMYGVRKIGIREVEDTPTSKKANSQAENNVSDSTDKRQNKLSYLD